MFVVTNVKHINECSFDSRVVDTQIECVDNNVSRILS